jgi:alpha-glucosidase
MRRALELRYRLIPMLYSLGHLAYDTGAPITRPLLMEFAGPRAASITDQWLLGSGLMTAPVLRKGGQRSVHFPKLPKDEAWFEFGSAVQAAGDKQYTVPLNSTLLFARSGTLLPLGPVVQHTGQLPGPDAELELQVYGGRDGAFTLVEDDGESRAYETGHVRRTEFKWDDGARTLAWKSTGNATDASMFRRMVVCLASIDGTVRRSHSVSIEVQGILHFEDQTMETLV